MGGFFWTSPPGTAQHVKLKKQTLALSILDLILISGCIGFAIFQIVILSTPDSSTSSTLLLPGTGRNTSFSTTTTNPNEIQGNNKEDKDIDRVDIACNSTTSSQCDDDEGDESIFNYKTLVGARISLSIQLIIYLSQFLFGILLLIGTIHNDSRSLHLWVLFAEVVVVIVALNLLINFFGKFIWWSVLFTLIYLTFKLILIRLVNTFIRVNDLQLTQFGSIGEFD